MLLDVIARSLYNISKEKSSEQISLSCYSAIVLPEACVYVGIRYNCTYV